MDPFSAVASAVGIGLQVYGYFKGSSAADESKKNLALKAEADQRVYAQQQNIIKAQQGIEAQRMQAMELDSSRKRREVARTAVVARANALAAAVGSGSEAGSVLPGAFGAIAGRSGVNELGINQNLGIGRNIFGFNQQVTNAKIAGVQAESQAAQYGAQAAQAQADVKEAQSIQSLGAGLMGNSDKIGSFATFATNKVSSSIFGGLTNNFSPGITS